MNKVEARVLRVFVNQEGKFGNPVGIVVDEHQKISPKDRQRVATKIGFSESVFIDNLKDGKISIFNPRKEVDFAGHALVGTAYFINKVIGEPVTSLECKAGRIQTWQEDSQTWIRASLTGTPPWKHEELQSAALIGALSTEEAVSKNHTMVWAWVDRDKGVVRVRTFAPDWGIPEDEANGSGSMQLASKLGQKLEIHHGRGSIIYAKPAEAGFAEVGGRVGEDVSQEVVI